MNIEIEDVKYLIRDTAQLIVDEYEDGVDFGGLVIENCDRATSDMCDGLAVIAKYGWSEALVGCDREDSPQWQFESDVYNLAKDLLEDEGYDVSDL